MRKLDSDQSLVIRGPKLERYADKMREILPKLGWFYIWFVVYASVPKGRVKKTTSKKCQMRTF